MKSWKSWKSLLKKLSLRKKKHTYVIGSPYNIEKLSYHNPNNKQHVFINRAIRKKNALDYILGGYNLDGNFPNKMIYAFGNKRLNKKISYRTDIKMFKTKNMCRKTTGGWKSCNKKQTKSVKKLYK